jgi:uncharacterized membrane protein YbhN (UPF0104 family)
MKFNRNQYTKVTTLFKFLVMVAALYYLYSREGLTLQAFSLSLRTLHYAIGGVLLIFISMLLAPLRHYLLLKAIEIDISYRDVLRVFLIGNLVGLFMFGNVGNDVVRYTYLKRLTQYRANITFSLLFDRFLGVFSTFFLGAIAIIVGYHSLSGDSNLHYLTMMIFSIFLITSGCIMVTVISLAKGRSQGGIPAWLLLLSINMALLFLLDDSIMNSLSHFRVTILCNTILSFFCAVLPPSLRSGHTLADFFILKIPKGKLVISLIDTIHIYATQFKSMVCIMILSVIIQSLSFISIYCFCFIFFQKTPDLVSVFIATPIAFLANIFPLPGGGLGAGELAFAHILQQVHLSHGDHLVAGATAFLFWRFWTLSLSLVGLPFYFLSKQKHIDLISVNQ